MVSIIVFNILLYLLYLLVLFLGNLSYRLIVRSYTKFKLHSFKDSDDMDYKHGKSVFRRQ